MSADPRLAVYTSFRVEIPMVELISWQISFLGEWAGCEPHTGASQRSGCEGLCSEALCFSRKHVITGLGGGYPWLIWMSANSKLIPLFSALGYPTLCYIKSLS